MPVDMSRYPLNWKTEIRPRILARANHRCERCGVENHAVGARDKFDVWHSTYDISYLDSDQIFDLFGAYPKTITIVLTIAHVNDPDPMNCADDNLAAWCQKCHNSHDAPMRVKNAAKTRRANKETTTGQRSLWSE